MAVIGLATVLGWSQPTSVPKGQDGEPVGRDGARSNPIASVALLGGEVRNASDTCGQPRMLTVQFLGPVSPRLEVSPGASEPVSLARGFYQVTIQTPDGEPLESPIVVVERKNFVWTFGCPPFAAPRAEPRSGGGRPVQFVNTTPDCGAPMTVVFVLNGDAAATVPAGRSAQGHAPKGEVLMEVVSVPENRRLLVRRLESVEAGQTLFYGCTDPEFASQTGGVPVVFENSTHACPSPQPLTLWVDGWPRIGLAPGQAKTVGVPKGVHEFEVRPGLLLMRLLQGSRDVQAPFRIRYGCSTQD